MMTLKNQHISVTINNSIASINIEQTFVNETQNPIEGCYMLPTDPDHVVSNLTIQIEDKIIEAKVVDKNTANEKYDDEISKGNTAVMT